MLERLNKANDVKVYSVFEEEFKPYGRVIEDFDFSSLIKISKAQIFTRRPLMRLKKQAVF